MQPRQHGVEYHATDIGQDVFVLVSNENALNSKVLTMPCSDLGNVTELVAHRGDVRVEDVRYWLEIAWRVYFGPLNDLDSLFIYFEPIRGYLFHFNLKCGFLAIPSLMEW